MKRRGAIDSASTRSIVEDELLLYEAEGLCRNGLPRRAENLLSKAIAILQNEADLGFLKLSYTEFYGDHR